MVWERRRFGLTAEERVKSEECSPPPFLNIYAVPRLPDQLPGAATTCIS